MTTLIDISGQRFGRWTALQRIVGAKWMCRCDCGIERAVLSANLRNGVSTSCGCAHRELLVARNRGARYGSTGGKPKDIAGHRFGRWTAISYEGHERWLARCDCGREKVLTKATLKVSMSCGCARAELNRSRAYKRTEARRASGVPACSRLSSVEEKRAYRKWKYRTDAAYRARRNRSVRAFLRTEKGKAVSARKNARRWGLTGALATFSATEWICMKDAWSNRCAYCGEIPDKLTQDHVVSLHRHGSHVAENIVPACQSCNTKKSNHPIGKALTLLGVDRDRFWAAVDAVQRKMSEAA